MPSAISSAGGSACLGEFLKRSVRGAQGGPLVEREPEWHLSHAPIQRPYEVVLVKFCKIVWVTGSRSYGQSAATETDGDRADRVPAGAARRDDRSARTARSRQGRARFWRGEANPCRRAPFWHSAIIDGRRSGNTIRVIPAGELRAALVSSRVGQRSRAGGSEREEWGFAKGKETAGFVPLRPPRFRSPFQAADANSRRCCFSCSFSTSMARYRVASTQISRRQLSYSLRACWASPWSAVSRVSASSHSQLLDRRWRKHRHCSKRIRNCRPASCRRQMRRSR